MITVKQLREFLAKYETTWSAQDDEILGKFEEQTLSVLIPEKGIAPLESIYDHAGLGFTFTLAEKP